MPVLLHRAGSRAPRAAGMLRASKPWRSALAHHEHDRSSSTAKDGLVNLVLTLALWAALLGLFLGVPHLLARSMFGSH
jgi:hypothetical protein